MHTDGEYWRMARPAINQACAGPCSLENRLSPLPLGLVVAITLLFMRWAGIPNTAQVPGGRAGS